MTDAETRALGERWQACRHFRWMPGMVTVDGCIIVDLIGGKGGPGELLRYWSPAEGSDRGYGSELLQPDPADPATKGCLLAQVRAWGANLDGPMHCTADDDDSRGERDYWCMYDGLLNPPDGVSEAEALIAALEAAPCTEAPKPGPAERVASKIAESVGLSVPRTQRMPWDGSKP